MRYVAPSVEETAFNCPHCGALAKQYWYHTHASSFKVDEVPTIFRQENIDEVKKDNSGTEYELPEGLLAKFEKAASGQPFLESARNLNPSMTARNVWLSRCFNCKEVAIWVYDRMLYPQLGEATPPNPDLPYDIARDYNEASSILDLSPRGAAALIRLAIQKLCIHLGQPGKNLNKDIGALVAEGLSVRVQQALDAVRVIGNNAVHPGSIDLHDDRATAETLFRLLNLIAEKTISEPKHVDEVYGSLPQSALDAIGKRDKPRDD